MSKAIPEFYQKLQPRERRLALAVAALLALFVLFALVRTAIGSVQSLQREIDQQQDLLVTYHANLARRQQVEQQYRQIATLHSSQWTAPEIADRLRQEIYRLAQNEPAPLNEEGYPDRISTGTGQLVSIPELRGGELKESEEGFRLYTISFSIPSAPIHNIFEYLHRIENSPQGLRVDRVQLERAWNAPLASADLTVTRVVVEGADTISAEEVAPPPEFVAAETEVEAEPEAPAAEPAPAELSDAPVLLDKAGWEVAGGAQFTDKSGDAVTVRVSSAGGKLYQTVELYAGIDYELELKLSTASDAVRLGFGDAETLEPIGQGVTLPPKDSAATYRVRFKVPGSVGEMVTVAAPMIVVGQANGELTIHAEEPVRLTPQLPEE